MRYDLRSRKSSSGEESTSSSDPISADGTRRRKSRRSEMVPPKSAPPDRPPRRVLRKRHSSNAFRVAQDGELEGILLFKEKPRQFLLLFVVILAVWYYSYTHDSEVFEQNVQSSIASASFIFLSYCFLQTRDGLLVRPHPGVWRIVHGCAVIYLIALAALSVQNVKNARRLLKVLFPEVGRQAHHEAGDASTCDINATTLYNGVSSIWFLAHVTGWWGKMCMFRDWRFCWVLSISFELLELSLSFMIPDFHECWWDSLFMDLLGANLIGMFLGRWTLMYLETQDYDWSGCRGNKIGFMRRALHQFSPFSWSRYHWEVFSSFKRFGQIMLALFVTLSAELNAFFLLRTLNIPKESHINKYRLFLVFCLGLPAASEYYEFISDPNCWRVGQNAWMMCSIVCFELLIWVKFLPATQELKKSPPPDVYIPIVSFLVLFSTWCLLFFSTKKRNSEQRKRNMLDVLFVVSFLPLLYLTKQWTY